MRRITLALVLGSAVAACASGDAPARAVVSVSSSATETAKAAGLEAPVVHDLGRGPIVARAARRVDGVEVFRGGQNVVMNRRFEPIATTGLAVPSLLHGPRGFEKSARDALAVVGPGRSFASQGTYGAYEVFDGGARTKRVYFPRKGGLEPAWYVELLPRAFVVSAITGKVLWSDDLTRFDVATYRVFASPDTKLPFDGPQGNGAVPLVVPSPNGFSPPVVPQQLVTLANYPFSKNDPWLPAGATMTSGNNVRAYSDVSAPDGYTPNSADTFSLATAPATFDYLDDCSQSAGSNDTVVKAGITQIFYTTNFLHDFFYDSGFDEKSGNAQFDNFGRGGEGGDPLGAATDVYTGHDNAFAITPADGASPSLQLFLFSGRVNANLTVAPPAPNAGMKQVGVAGDFGARQFLVTGTTVLAEPSDACDALPASVAGQIVIANRGNCSFVTKANSALDAGALGLVIVNVATSAEPSVAPFMGGTSPDNTLPVLSLNVADGQALTAGQNVTMRRDPSPDIEGALDDQIVAHEWTHVLSSRLVADGSGLDTTQARGLGEGWSDFVALILTARPDDHMVPANANWAGVYPIGTYATSGQSELYFGIRRVPYSTDMTKDPLTFKHISDDTPLPTGVPFDDNGSPMSEVHNTGEVWATMLWECYAALLNRYPFDEAQSRMKGYLVASLKMTPPSPTFVDARDALLATAYAADPLDFDSFWKAFAKRGLGVAAVAPSRDSVDNNGVVESFEFGNAVSVVSFGLTDDVLSCDHDGIVDEGEIGSLQVTVKNTGSGTLEAAQATVTSASTALSFVDSNVVSLGTLEPFQTKTATLKVMFDGTTDLAPAVLDIQISDPTLPKPVSVSLAAHHGVDEVPDSSATDDVEPSQTSWTVTAQDVTGTSVKWARIADPGGTNHAWFVPNAEESADHRLISPPLDVSQNQFTLAWRHRWSFESSEEEKLDFDGGVVELSLDNGATWDDLSKYGVVDYNTTLADLPDTAMVLKGRRAYGNTSPGYPDQWVHSSVQVTLPAAHGEVRVRFRHGADDNTGAVGWEIDDIALTGIDNTPFTSFVPQRSACDSAAPTAVAPASETVRANDAVSLTGSGTSPKGVPVTLSWRQDDGPTVTLSGRDTATLSFVAPAVAERTPLTFALYASDGTLVGAPARVQVIVEPPSESGCGCRTAPSRSGEGAAALAVLGFVMLRVRRRIY